MDLDDIKKLYGDPSSSLTNKADMYEYIYTVTQLPIDIQQKLLEIGVAFVDDDIPF